MGNSTHYGERRRARCAAAERALMRAVEQSGTLVPGPAILRTWPEVNSDLSLPSPLKQKRWSSVLRPAIDAGRVQVVRKRGQFYFGPASREYALPERELKPPRQYSARLKACAEDAEKAIACAAQRHGRMVSAVEIAEVWPEVHGVVAPAILTRRSRRILLPATDAGRVRVVSVLDHLFYAPADLPKLQPPDFPSDLMRVEEALRRAVARLRSPVPVQTVAAEIESDPQLELGSDLAPTYFIASLVKTGRARTIPNKRVPQADNYYTMPEGPFHVRAAAENHLDKRLRAARLLWRHSGRMPFRTHALRRYAEERPSLRITDDPVYGWTNALQYFEGLGLLVRITAGEDRPRQWASGPERYVLWAPADAWSKLDPEEQARRMAEVTDVHRSHSPPKTAHDVGRISRAHDLRALVMLAQRVRAEGESNADRKRILTERPVTSREVAKAARARPDLAPKGSRIANALREASRRRKYIRVPTIWRAGRVANRIYYAAEENAHATAYVQHLEVLRASTAVSLLRRAVVELREVRELAAARLLPLPEAVVCARVDAITSEADALCERLEHTHNQAKLLEEELRKAQRRIEELKQVSGNALRLRPTTGSQTRTDSGDLSPALDTAEAWEQIDGLVDYQMTTPRLLIARLNATIPTVAAPEGDMDRSGQRPVERRFDRIAFACYAAARWGGPTLAAFTGKARAAIGACRDPRAFITAIRSTTAPGEQAAVAAALGLFDDRASRRALADFLTSIVTLGETELQSRSGSITAASIAAYGLAPLPFGGLAQTLEAVEREALQAIAQRGDLEPARALAGRVLRAWDEAWGRDQLIYL